MAKFESKIKDFQIALRLLKGYFGESQESLAQRLTATRKSLADWMVNGRTPGLVFQRVIEDTIREKTDLLNRPDASDWWEFEKESGTFASDFEVFEYKGSRGAHYCCAWKDFRITSRNGVHRTYCTVRSTITKDEFMKLSSVSLKKFSKGELLVSQRTLVDDVSFCLAFGLSKRYNIGSPAILVNGTVAWGSYFSEVHVNLVDFAVDSALGLVHTTYRVSASMDEQENR